MVVSLLKKHAALLKTFSARQYPFLASQSPAYFSIVSYSLIMKKNRTVYIHFINLFFMVFIHGY